MVPADKVEEVMVRTPDPIVIERLADFDCAGLPESVTVAVKLELPAVVGVPETVPFGARESPAGRLPEETVQL